MEGVRLNAGVLKSRPAHAMVAGDSGGARRILEWHTSIRGVDEPLTRHFRGGVRLRVRAVRLALPTSL